jgi:uncharacterized protein YndB with AHSA1/START domain
MHMGVLRVKTLIRAPLPQVWDFLIRPENLHLWGPPTRPVAGFDRPFQVGDRVTYDRRDFLWDHRQALLVEKVLPGHSLHLRDLSATAMDVTVTLRVEEAEDREATWVEEAIFYSLGSGRVLQWLDRWLINPVFNLPMAYKGNQVFRRLQVLLEKPHPDSILGSSQEKHKSA